MSETLALTHGHYRQMREHVESCLPNEACGMAGGRDGRVEVVIPVRNALASPVRFQMEPVEQLQAHLQLDEQGLDVAAIYHSHPFGPSHPSQTDVREYTYPASVALIWSKESGSWQLRAFRIREGIYQEVPLDWLDSA